MPELAVDLYRRSCDLFNRRDWDGFLTMMDEDIEVESRLAAMEGGYHGHEGLRRWWDDLLRSLPDYRVELLELRERGDELLARVRGLGSGEASATPVIDPFWHALRWRDGRCVWWRNCSTESEALEALGWSDRPTG